MIGVPTVWAGLAILSGRAGGVEGCSGTNAFAKGPAVTGVVGTGATGGKRGKNGGSRVRRGPG